MYIKDLIWCCVHWWMLQTGYKKSTLLAYFCDFGKQNFHICDPWSSTFSVRELCQRPPLYSVWRHSLLKCGTLIPVPSQTINHVLPLPQYRCYKEIITKLIIIISLPLSARKKVTWTSLNRKDIKLKITLWTTQTCYWWIYIFIEHTYCLATNSLFKWLTCCH